MMRNSSEQLRLSPLFADTEFVPANLHYFTVYNHQISSIPGVLPYHNDQITFGQLEGRVSRVNQQLDNETSIIHQLDDQNALSGMKIKEIKRKAFKKKLDGEQIQINSNSSQLIDFNKILNTKGAQEESGERCNICCIMMENKEDVIHISLKWKSEEDALSEIVREINNRYEVELSEGDIQLNQITFKCKTEPNGVTHIKFTPNVIENLTEVIFNSDKLVYIGVYVLSNRFTSDKYLGKQPKYTQLSQAIIQINLPDSKSLKFQYHKIKQFQISEILGILDVEKPESRGLRVLDRIYEPNTLMLTLQDLYDSKALINFISAEVTEEVDVFLESVNQYPELSQNELRKLRQASPRQSFQRHRFDKKEDVSSLSLFNSNCRILSNKQTEFDLLYHMIHKYIRNRYTHFSSLFETSIASRLVKGLIEQVKSLPAYEGWCFRKIGYELSYQQKDIIQFKNFIITTLDKTLIEKSHPSLYFTKSTIIKIFSKTGRNISSFSSFEKLQEVIFLPFTKFEVKQRFEDEISVYYTLQEVERFEPSNHTCIILWVDDKQKQGRNTFNIIKQSPKSILLFQLASTTELDKWIKQHKTLVTGTSIRIIMITNMRRVEEGTQNPIAGVFAINTAKIFIPQAKIIVYIGNIQNTTNNLIKGGVDPKTLFITNHLSQLLEKIEQYCFREQKQMPSQSQHIEEHGNLDINSKIVHQPEINNYHQPQEQDLNHQEHVKTQKIKQIKCQPSSEMQDPREDKTKPLKKIVEKSSETQSKLGKEKANSDSAMGYEEHPKEVLSTLMQKKQHKKDFIL